MNNEAIKAFRLYDFVIWYIGIYAMGYILGMLEIEYVAKLIIVILANSLIFGTLVMCRLNKGKIGLSNLYTKTKFKFKFMTMIGYWLIIILLGGGLESLLSYYFPAYLNSLNSNFYYNMYSNNLSNNILIIILIVLVTPIIEETFFRGIIFERLKMKANIKISIIVTSILFGVLHGSMISAFIFSIMIFIFYKKHGSLYAGMIFHGFANLLALIAQSSTSESVLNFESPMMIGDSYRNVIIGSILFIAVLKANKEMFRDEKKATVEDTAKNLV